LKDLLRAFLVVVCAAAFVAPAMAEEAQSPPAEKGEAVQADASPEKSDEEPAEAMKEPDHIKVQHILIGFAGSSRGTSARRSADEARSLSREVLKRAQDGEDFAQLSQQYSDDRPPGIYGMSNSGVAPASAPPGEYPRDQMVPAFGNVGFKLKVGEVGMSDYDPKDSPFGYHIIKRLE
jgi:parvulin-like peptidyl-prolyl isomerase